MRIAAWLALAAAACGSPTGGVENDNAISRSTDEALAWVDSLPLCAADDGGRRGLLDAHGGVCTARECPETRCCNRCDLRELELFGAGEAVRVELSPAVAHPALVAGGEGLLDCEWVAWRAVLRRARVRADGSMEQDTAGSFLAVDRLCRQ